MLTVLSQDTLPMRIWVILVRHRILQSQRGGCPGSHYVRAKQRCVSSVSYIYMFRAISEFRPYRYCLGSAGIDRSIPVRPPILVWTGHLWNCRAVPEWNIYVFWTYVWRQIESKWSLLFYIHIRKALLAQLSYPALVRGWCLEPVWHWAVDKRPFFCIGSDGLHIDFCIRGGVWSHMEWLWFLALPCEWNNLKVVWFNLIVA